MEDIVYIGSKNKYGYTKRQLMIDYKNKTFQIGQFKMSVKNVTNKAIDKKIEELKMLGFKEVYEKFEEIKKECFGVALDVLQVIEDNKMELAFLEHIKEMNFSNMESINNYLWVDRDRIYSKLGLYSDEL